jgi:hypothetical protein
MRIDVQIISMQSRIFLPFLLGLGALVLSLIIRLAAAGTTTGAVPPAAQPVPAVVNAWGVLLQAGQRLQAAAGPGQREDRREDLLLSGAALRVLQAENGKNVPVNIEIATQLQKLIQQNAAMLESGGGKISEKSYADLEKFYDPKLIEQAGALANQYRCAMHPEVLGPKGTNCPRCGMALTSPVRLTLDAASAAIPPRMVRARVQVDAPLQVGVRVIGHLTLTSLTGEPITPEQLREVHTRKIHLLIIDGSLTDYHHEHPVPSPIPGCYDFSFTPQKPGTYRIWADVQPVATDVQEFAMTVIPANTRAEPLKIEPDSLTNTVNGLHYAIEFEQPVKSGEPVQATLHVTQADGSGYSQLEPIMGAFAHIVGFRDDRTSALHIHPEIARPLSPEDRGGPDLRFRFYAAKPGFYRLFVQVQRNGQSEFVPFALNIPLGKMPSEWEKNNCSSGKSGPTVFDYGIRITKTTLRQQRARAAHRCKNDGNTS